MSSCVSTHVRVARRSCKAQYLQHSAVTAYARQRLNSSRSRSSRSDVSRRLRPAAGSAPPASDKLHHAARATRTTQRRQIHRRRQCHRSVIIPRYSAACSSDPHVSTHECVFRRCLSRNVERLNGVLCSPVRIVICGNYCPKFSTQHGGLKLA